MKYWVGVTDNAWFRFLSSERPDEVNFWQPRGEATYAALEPGSLFLFKLKRPYNHIAGGGFFVKSSSLPLSMAWDAFGRKNGAASRQQFESLIRPLASAAGTADPLVGCTVLASPFFWPQQRWIASPPEWSTNIVRGRYYDSRLGAGLLLWNQAQARLEQELVNEETQPRHGSAVLVKPRLGQGGFRVVVTDAYHRRCAITGESTLPVLEAAHILPFSENGPHDVSNGLLLRSDFHKLFDLGLVTVTPDLTVEVSSRIKAEWFNGKSYYRLQGQRLASLPDVVEHRPSPALLQWHNENRFRA